MANNNEERPIRLRPRRSKGNPNDDPRRYVGALGAVLRFVQMTKRRRKTHGHSPSQSRARWQSRSPRLYSQRVSVRVTYAKNKNPGQWKAHGHYIARDSATKESDPSRAGFDATRTNINLATTLDTWQRAGDDRIFKIIVSPEFGERLNLQDQTRQLLTRMEKDLGSRLEWVAAVHFNTEHPHAHIALRGKDQTGASLRLARDYIRSGIRFHAENLATEALGFRTERDAQNALRREIAQSRFTTLDRIIQRSNHTGSSSFRATTNVCSAGLSERERILQQSLSARLSHLEKMGLANSVGPQQWMVQNDFETVLKTLQRAGDHQKMLAAHGARMSDPRLPFEIINIRQMKGLEGRVLLHAEDEATGQTYSLIEGTDAKVYLLRHTESIKEARHLGKFVVNDFVRIEKRFAGKIPELHVFDLGKAEALLSDENFIRRQALILLSKGCDEIDTSWGGWLGQYREAVNRHLKAARGPQRRGSELGR